MDPDSSPYVTDYSNFNFLSHSNPEPYIMSIIPVASSIFFSIPSFLANQMPPKKAAKLLSDAAGLFSKLWAPFGFRLYSST